MYIVHLQIQYTAKLNELFASGCQFPLYICMVNTVSNCSLYTYYRNAYQQGSKLLKGRDVVDLNVVVYNNNKNKIWLGCRFIYKITFNEL